MRKIAFHVLLLAALALVASCASTPPKEPTQETPPPVQPTVSGPDAELAQAKSLRQKVDSYGLGSYAPDEYAAANKDLQAGQDSYGKDNEASRKSLQASIDGYNAVIAKGGPLYLAGLQAQTEASKKAADDLKASVAVKDDYANADAAYRRALKEKDANDIEKAKNDFIAGRDGFDAAAKAAQQKRDAAAQALQAAQQRMSDSERKAADAQKTLKDEGFAAQGGGQ